MSILPSPSSAVKNPEPKRQESAKDGAKITTQKPTEIKKKKVAKKVKTVRNKTSSVYLPLVIGFIFTLLLLVGIIFSYQKLTNLSQQAEQSRGQMLALEDRELSLKKLSLDFQSVQSEITVIDQALPDEQGIVDFVKQFREITQDVSVEVFSFQTDQPNTDSAGNYFLDFNVELRGSFENLRIFLTKLIGLPYLIKLQIVDIDQTILEEPKMVINARILVNNPFFQEAKK